MERVYKTMRNAGALNIVIGIIITVAGLSVGIMSIINGAVLLKRKSEITEEFIGIVAQSLDFVENDGELEERYAAVMQYLRTVMRYESGRLR